MGSEYSETLWEKIVNCQYPWDPKGPFCGKKKGFRQLRVSNRLFGRLGCAGNTMAL